MTRLRRDVVRTALVAMTTAVAVTAPALPANASFGHIAVLATYSGAQAGGGCNASSCTVSVSSLVCEAVGLTQARVPFAGGCTATLTYTVQAVVAGGQAVCTVASDGVFTFDVAGFSSSWPAVVVIGSNGVASYTSRAASIDGIVDVGAAEGTVAPACVPNERVPQAISGTFSYGRVF